MRYIITSRRHVWMTLGIVLGALLLWYGLSGPGDVATSGVEIHRLTDGATGTEPSGVESSAPGALSPAVTTGAPSGTSGFAAEYNLERARQRSSRAEALARIIEDPATSQAVRDEAQRKALQDLETQTAEAELTRLLRAEGFKEPVVVLNDRGLTVSLYGVVLDGATANRVGELAARMTGVAPEKIVIMERR